MVDFEAAAFEAVEAASLNGEVMDQDRFEEVLGWCGRITAPFLLAEAWDTGVVGAAEVASCVGSVWSGSEFPDSALGHPRWRELFQAAGFTRDGEPAERPDQPLELWRGTVPERCRDWSWSTDRTLAERYANGGFRRPTGRLYRVVAPPATLLAAYNGRAESEYVIDTHGLDIMEWRSAGEAD